MPVISLRLEGIKTITPTMDTNRQEKPEITYTVADVPGTTQTEVVIDQPHETNVTQGTTEPTISEAKQPQMEPQPRTTSEEIKEELLIRCCQNGFEQFEHEHVSGSGAVEGEVVEENKAIPDAELPKQVGIRDDKGRFVPGVSGNPNGRPPRDWTWKELLEDATEEYRETKKMGKVPVKKLLSRTLINLALGGNIHALKEVMNRMDGMPQQSIGLDGVQLPSPIVGGLSNAIPTNNSNK